MLYLPWYVLNHFFKIKRSTFLWEFTDAHWSNQLRHDPRTVPVQRQATTGRGAGQSKYNHYTNPSILGIRKGQQITSMTRNTID